jgi:uncharacterized protein with NRDE domain/threonine/homoserine/homoserine lactone efflux protein
MGQAIGQSITFAVGVAISPIPIIAIILMLVSKRAGVNSLAFGAGWVIGVAGATAVVIAVSGAMGTGSEGSASHGVSVVKLVLGVALLSLGLRNWRKRPGPGETATLPTWLESIENITPVKTGALGVILSALNPKNLLLMVAGGLAIAGAPASTGDKTVAAVVCMVISVSTVIVPVVLYRVLGERAQATHLPIMPNPCAIGPDRCRRGSPITGVRYSERVCLLVFAWQTEPEYPLVVAANRDERLDRPACSLCVLREEDPRVLGGRDDLAGGTWLAVNEHGVVAGLTNRPSPGGRDATKRSRGELPLMVAAQDSAEAGVAELLRRVEPGQYNPAWLLVGDRTSLVYVELAIDRPPESRRLGPGIHVLENAPLGDPSMKVDRVRSLESGARASGTALWAALPTLLGDHVLPAAGGSEPGGDADQRPLATLAACVHTEEYGTRSAALVRVPAEEGSLPEMLVADGPSCTTPFVDVADHWAA